MTKSASEVRDELKQRRKKRGGGGKHDYLKVAPDTTVYLRIGPPSKEEGEIWKDVYFHGGFKRKVYCAQNDVDEDSGKRKKCLIEKRLSQLKSDHSKKGKKLWSLINQKSEGLWNVLLAKVKKSESGRIKVRKYDGGKFKLWRLSYKWHNALLDIFADEDYRRKSILGVAHPKYGRLIKVTRSGGGRDDTNYTFKPVDKESPIFEDSHKRHKILKTLVDLDELVHGSSKDELESFLHRMEKKAKSLAREDEEDESKGDSDADSSSSESDESKSESSSSESSSSSSESEDDLESQYKKMKKDLKKKKKHHHESES